MSTLATRRLTTLLGPAATRIRPTAAFSTSSPTRKTVLENVKDGARAVDRSVSDKLVSGINAAEKAASKAKDLRNDVLSSTPGTHASDLANKAAQAGSNAAEQVKQASAQAADKASQMAGQAQNSGSQAAGQVSGKASEAVGAAKGKAEEMQGKASGMAEEVKGKAKGTAEEVKGKM